METTTGGMQLFSVLGSVFIDDKDSSKKLDNINQKAEGVGGKLRNMIGTAAKWGNAIAAGAAAATIAVAGLASVAVSSYADYEQLVGGVETLFKDSAGLVQEYAKNAYKTAGMTANQYMETVTSFSASLLQGLNGDTAEAAKVADMAITDMSDNANKMGTSLSSIQNAYQGFAKQNYTMLDNLKLGYGGTKAEMERLLADAEKLSGHKYDISNLNEVYEAIHVVQTELGITGTTAKEATGTISGSINMIKAKFEDFKVSIGEAVAPVVQSFLSLVIDNLPTIEGMIGQVIPVISNLMSTILPPVMELSSSSLPVLVELFNSLIPVFGDITAVMIPLIATFAEMAQSILPPIIKLFSQVVSDILPPLLAIFNELAEIVLPLVMTVFEAMLPVIEPIMNMISAVIKKVLALIKGDWEGVWSGIKEFFGSALDYITALVQGWAKVFGGILTGDFEMIKEGVMKIWNSLWDWIKNTGKFIRDIGKNIVTALWDGIKDMWGKMTSWVGDKVKSLANALNPFKSSGGVTITGGPNMQGLATGGDVYRSGVFRVGEQGPETVFLPAGAAVRPGGGNGSVNVNLSDAFILDDYGVDRLMERIIQRLALLGVTP